MWECLGCSTALLLARLNGSVLFCSLSSVVVVCNAAGGQAREQSDASGPAAWALGQPILHGGPVRLRPVLPLGRHLVISALIYVYII